LKLNLPTSPVESTPKRISLQESGVLLEIRGKKGVFFVKNGDQKRAAQRLAPRKKFLRTEIF